MVTAFIFYIACLYAIKTGSGSLFLALIFLIPSLMVDLRIIEFIDDKYIKGE